MVTRGKNKEKGDRETWHLNMSYQSPCLSSLTFHMPLSYFLSFWSWILDQTIQTSWIFILQLINLFSYFCSESRNKMTDFKSSWCFIFHTEPCFGCLHHVTVAYVFDISEFLAASIFSKEMSKVMKCSVLWTQGRGRRGQCLVHPSGNGVH